MKKKTTEKDPAKRKIKIAICAIFIAAIVVAAILLVGQVREWKRRQDFRPIIPPRVLYTQNSIDTDMYAYDWVRNQPYKNL